MKKFPCPCQSGKPYKECCEPYHTGIKEPSSPVLLMRSRYSAYAKQACDYIITTTHPKNPTYRKDYKQWLLELRSFCQSTAFKGLEILDHSQNGKRGTVTFFAKLSQKNTDASFGEKSSFIKENDRWFYLDGTHV